MTAMALTSVPAAAQSKTGIAVVDLQRAVATSSAYSTARTQIQTTYKAQIDGFTARKNAIDADLKRSEEHTSELQSLMRTSYAVFCLKKKKTTNNKNTHT